MGMLGKKKVVTVAFLLPCLGEFSSAVFGFPSLPTPLAHPCMPTCHPFPRSDTLLPNQLLELVADTLDGSLPFFLQKIVSHQGRGVWPPTETLYHGPIPAGTPLLSL